MTLSVNTGNGLWPSSKCLFIMLHSNGSTIRMCCVNVVLGVLTNQQILNHVGFSRMRCSFPSQGSQK